MDELLKMEEKRLVYGIVYPVYDEGESDSQGDFMEPEEIEKMAHDFLAKSRAYDLHHMVTDVPDATVVESYIAPVDFYLELPSGPKLIKKGSWVVVTKFTEKLWERVKKGEFRSYSIRGKGIRKPIV